MSGSAHLTGSRLGIAEVDAITRTCVGAARGAATDDDGAAAVVGTVRTGGSRFGGSTGASEVVSGLLIPTLHPPATSNPSAPAERRKPRLVNATDATSAP